MKYSSELLLKICSTLETGTQEKDAGPLCGISERTYFYWKNKYSEFKSKTELSILKHKQKLIHYINLGAGKDPKIALEILKIRWPHEWNPTFNISFIDPEAELKKTLDILKGVEPKNEL